MYTPGDITLYIPCFHAENTLAEVLDAVSKQTVSPNTILLIDDGSVSPLADRPGVTIIRHDVNRGLAAARNTALQHCETPLIAALDADVVPADNWLEILLDAMNRGGIAGVSGRMDEKYAMTLADRWRAIHMQQHWGDQPVTNPRFLFGANTLFQTDALHNAGGYDVQHRTNDEDRTLCDQLYSRGLTLHYQPEARCRHLRRDTLTGILRGYWRWHYTKGLLRGDFDTPERLIARMEAVNFGIFQYRFQRDSDAGRTELPPLDACIPWVFCAQDLLFYAEKNSAPVPPFPESLLREISNPTIRNILARMIPPSPARELNALVWGSSYLDSFKHLLDESRWFACANACDWSLMEGTLK